MIAQLNIFRNNAPYIMAFFAALVMGGAAATGKPIFSVLVAGTLGGLFLISQPIALLWAVLYMTLVIAGTTYYFIPTLQHIFWAAYGMGAMLFVPAIMSRLNSDSQRVQLNFSPRFLAALIILVCGLFAAFINHSPLWEVTLALKSILLYGGVWAALAMLPISKDVVKRWLFGFLIIGLIQWLPAIYQYLFVRADRLTKGLGTIEASDSVVGTFGGTMDSGGFTAVLAAYLVILIVALLAFHRQRLLESGKLFLIIPLLFIPLLLMEVKVILIYLPVSLFILYKDVIWRRPFAFIGGSMGILILLVGIIFAYQSLHWSSDGANLENNIESMSSYSFAPHYGDDAQADGVMSRREVIEFWWQKHGLDEPVNMFLGHGLGASSTSGLAAGHIAAQYAPRHIDITGLAVLLWDTGLIGVLAIATLLLSAYRTANRLSRSVLLEPWQRALAQGLRAVTPIFAISVVYRSDIPYAGAMMFMLMTILGLLAWLSNEERPGSFESKPMARP